MQMGEKNRENSLSEIFNDYEKTPVPPKARQTWFEQGMVWLGSGFGLSGLATGGLLANGLSFKEMLLVSVLGSLIITLLGMLNAIVSTHLHLSTSFTSQKAVRTPGSEDNRHYPVLFQLWLVRIPGGSVRQYGFLYYKRSEGNCDQSRYFYDYRRTGHVPHRHYGF